MIRSNRALSFASFALVASHVALGCADDAGDGASVLGDDAGLAADGSAGPALDAQVEGDAASDALVDAAVDSALPTCSEDGWCYTPIPTRDEVDAGPPPAWGPKTVLQMNAVWPSPDHTTWAVTQSGHVLRWNGTTWNVVAAVGKPLLSIWGASANDLWIGGDNSLVLRGTVDGDQLTLTPFPADNLQQGAKSILGKSPSDIWILGSFGGVFHLQTPAGGGAASFVQMDLPSDFPGPDYIGPFAAAALWGNGDEVWVAGNDDRYWCDMNGCVNPSEFVVRKWKGGNDGDASWDRIRMFPSPQDFIESYARVRLGVSTSDGVQVVTINGGTKTYAIRIATNDAKLAPGEIGIQHDGPYSWTVERVNNFVGPEGIWATSSSDVWLAGPAGIRHFDGTQWQIGRLSIEPDVPLLQNLHAITGPSSSSSGIEMWSVGDDVAIHRKVTP